MSRAKVWARFQTVSSRKFPMLEIAERLARRSYQDVAGQLFLAPSSQLPAPSSHRPTNASLFEKKKQLGGKCRRRQGAGHCLERLAFGGGGIGIEAHRQGFHQGRPVRSLYGVEPGVTRGNLAAGQPYPHRAIQPAGPLGQGSQERLGQQETLAGGGNRPKPQFASLITPMQHHPPPEGRPFQPIPVEHPNQLLA